MPLDRRHLLLGAAAPLLALPRNTAAQAPTRWQMACAYPDGNYHTRNIREFLADIEGTTGGKLATTLHSNASLLPMPQIKRGTQQGQVQMGEILLSAYANEDPFFDADAIPQLVTNFAEARRLAAVQKPFVEARLARQGMMLLYMVPWPTAGFYTNAPLANLEGLRGTRMRTFSTMTNRFATLVGATPTLVQAAEVAQAFATGVVNSMVTSAQSGVDTSAWDYARVFTQVGFSMTKNAVFVSRRALEALPADVQAGVTAAAARAEARGYGYAEEAQGAAERRLAERGVQVMPGSPELLEGLRGVSRAMAEEWVGKAGEDGRKLLEAYRAG